MRLSNREKKDYEAVGGRTCHPLYGLINLWGASVCRGQKHQNRNVSTFDDKQSECNTSTVCLLLLCCCTIVFPSCRRSHDAACERRALMEDGRGARRHERPHATGLPRGAALNLWFSHWISFTPSTTFIWDTIYRSKTALVLLHTCRTASATFWQTV